MTTTYSPRQIPYTEADVPNSGRGQYLWLEVPPDPAGWAAPDVYYRDQLQWRKKLETTRGVYNFSTVDAGLAEAEARGGRLSFRVMAFCPGCGDNLAPSYIPTQPNGVVKWNSEQFLSGWEGLMSALGSAYDSDPRLQYIDIGGYSAFGEWGSNPGYGEEITRANGQRVMKAAIDAFPSKPKMINWMNGWPEYAAALGPKVGIRNDSVGGFSNTYLGTTDAVNNAWKTAPMVGEWSPSSAATPAFALQNIREFHISHLSSGNHRVLYANLSTADKKLFRDANSILGFRYNVDRTVLEESPTAGEPFSVSMRWTNGGVAPTYDEWTPTFVLLDGAGAVAWSATVPLDLRTVLPGSKQVSFEAALPVGLVGGYTAAVRVVSAGSYLQPMRLAQDGGTTGGFYTLGPVTVTAATGSGTGPVRHRYEAVPKDQWGSLSPVLQGIDADLTALETAVESST